MITKRDIKEIQEIRDKMGKAKLTNNKNKKENESKVGDKRFKILCKM